MIVKVVKGISHQEVKQNLKVELNRRLETSE
jgi:hypothetical protein